MPPPTDGFVSLVTSGVEEKVRERFGAAGVRAEDVACERATCIFRHPGPPVELPAQFKTYCGPTMNAFEAATKNGLEGQPEAELMALFEPRNPGGADSGESPATYLKEVVSRS